MDKERIEENFVEELKELLDRSLDNFNEQYTCYDNFKDIIPIIFAKGFEKGIAFERSNKTIEGMKK